MMLNEQGGEEPSGTTYEKGRLYRLPIETLRADPNQPRKAIDPTALGDLKESIGKYGIIQPLLFRPGEQGYVYVVSGERRLQAAKELNMLMIPAVCVGDNYAEIALIENLPRQDLTAVEEAEALQRLIAQKGYTQEQLGGIVNKARSTISEILSLNKLPQQIRDERRGDRQISLRTLIEIAGHKTEAGMISAYEAYKAKLLPGAPSLPKDPNDPAAFFSILEKTGAKIEAIDTGNWGEDDMTNLGDSVAILRERLDARFPSAEPSTELA